MTYINLHEALETAQALDIIHHGMADLRLAWNPYEGYWAATVTWSNGRVITRHNTEPDKAIDLLINSLRREAEKKC